MDREAILLGEYTEIGTACRAQEEYVRATLNMCLVLSVAVAGFLFSATASAQVRSYVCFGAFAVGLCMLLLVLRHRKVYGVLVKRALKIEAELKTEIYATIKRDLSARFDASAKTLSAFIIGFIALVFLVAAFVLACGV